MENKKSLDDVINEYTKKNDISLQELDENAFTDAMAGIGSGIGRFARGVVGNPNKILPGEVAQKFDIRKADSMHYTQALADKKQYADGTMPVLFNYEQYRQAIQNSTTKNGVSLTVNGKNYKATIANIPGLMPNNFITAITSRRYGNTSLARGNTGGSGTVFGALGGASLDRGNMVNLDALALELAEELQMGKIMETPAGEGESKEKNFETPKYAYNGGRTTGASTDEAETERSDHISGGKVQNRYGGFWWPDIAILTPNGQGANPVDYVDTIYDNELVRYYALSEAFLPAQDIATLLKDLVNNGVLTTDGSTDTLRVNNTAPDASTISLNQAHYTGALKLCDFLNVIIEKLKTAEGSSIMLSDWQSYVSLTLSPTMAGVEGRAAISADSATPIVPSLPDYAGSQTNYNEYLRYAAFRQQAFGLPMYPYDKRPYAQMYNNSIAAAIKTNDNALGTALDRDLYFLPPHLVQYYSRTNIRRVLAGKLMTLGNTVRQVMGINRAITNGLKSAVAATKSKHGGVY
jgi:hypothetical protein